MGRHPAQRLALASNFSDLFNRRPKTWRIMRLSFEGGEATSHSGPAVSVRLRLRNAIDYERERQVPAHRRGPALPQRRRLHACAHNLAGSPSRLAETGLLTSRRRMRLVPSRQKNISSTISRSSFLASGPRARGTAFGASGAERSVCAGQVRAYGKGSFDLGQPTFRIAQ